MATETIVTNAKPVDIKLRRWCVEMAIQWPIHHETGHKTENHVHQDEDVIGRASQIFNWVKNVKHDGS
jgi:hypothetical protein